jgi:acyl carrier protein
MPEMYRRVIDKASARLNEEAVAGHPKGNRTDVITGNHMRLCSNAEEIVMETDTIIADFIKDKLLGEDDELVLRSNASLVSAGILDSVSVLKLLVFIEERFSVKVADEELTPGNFETIERITAFINTKTRTIPD